jgi:hypothetical protein
MQEKRFPILRMSQTKIDLLKLAINAHAFDSLGMFWTKRISWHVDFVCGELVFNWE